MNKVIATTLCAGGFALVASVAFDRPAGAQDLLEACSTDIGTHCAAVVPGNGRLASCLYAHEDKLSEPCDIAFGETADIMDMVFERLRFAKQQCSADIATHCADVEVGQGQIFSCLRDQAASLSDGCRGLVERVDLPAD